MTKQNCAICHSIHSDITVENKSNRHFKVTCTNCGIYYFIDPIYKVKVMNGTDVGLTNEELKKLSFLLRHNYEFGSSVTLTFENIDTLIDDFNPSNDLFERIELLLLYIYKSLKYPTDSVNINNMAPIVFCDNLHDLFDYTSIAKELGLIKSPNNMHVTLTPKGWKEVKEIQKKQVDSKKAFVAMWFDGEVDDLWDNGFFPALNQLGYEPLRIDKKEHINKIDDQIIAEIRKSGLLIADFTGNRNGVYFEAGFAMGLGIPVIWTCREDHLDDVHFDIRQYNQIVWKTPEELKEKLTYRIEATIPNRPTPRKPEDKS
jgi:hypothetical protein|tara:strand:- start:13352 stop:14299 length:948 start_codon:yes stop_codon:yes gene_type:complete